MQFARHFEEFERRGAQLAGISVDSLDDNAAMVQKLHLPFPLLSDAQGAVIQRYDVWNADEKIAIPAIVVLDQSGHVRYRYAGRDFADRPPDTVLFDALDDEGSSHDPTLYAEPGIVVTAEQASHTIAQDRRAMTLAELVVYFRGVFFATVALKQRLSTGADPDRAAIREIGAYQSMARDFGEALKATSALVEPSTGN